MEKYLCGGAQDIMLLPTAQGNLGDLTIYTVALLRKKAVI